MADEAEKRAKIERDSIDIFGVSMKFDEFYEIEKDLDEVVAFLEKEQDDKTAFYYKLIELCDMRENLYKALSRDKKYKNYRFNPQDALWKSKLNYLFRRNVRREDNDSRIFNLLNSLIEKGEKFKPLLFLKIYNNRDKKQGEKNENIG
jgi:CRISPR-associated protein Csm1